MLDGTCLSATLQAILAEMTAEENVDAEADAAAEQPLDEDSDEDDEDDAVGVVEGGRVLGDVVLARRPGTPWYIFPRLCFADINSPYSPWLPSRFLISGCPYWCSQPQPTHCSICLQPVIP